MRTDPSHVLTADETLAADQLFAILLAERDADSPVADLAFVAAPGAADARVVSKDVAAAS
jgi:hypothetical protein